MPNSKTQLRQHARMPTTLSLKFSFGEKSKSHNGQMCNLSSGGLQFISLTVIPKQTNIKLSSKRGRRSARNTRGGKDCGLSRVHI